MGWDKPSAKIKRYALWGAFQHCSPTCPDHKPVKRLFGQDSRLDKAFYGGAVTNIRH